ncbi:hypothetical protein ABZY93_08445 [Streptomyces smyrnaeus]|uniref:hypothetical protein n=1 Tax=Streptomyces smyrnaeus TaxID=1387713 RepID=UPI0033B2F4FA
MRTLTRSLGIGLVTLGLAAAGTASAVAGGHGKVHKEIHNKKVVVKISDDDNIINDSAFFAFGGMQNG